MIEYSAMTFYRWAHITKEPMNPLLALQVIHGEKMTVAKVHLHKGAIVPLHHHVNEQFSTIESGRLRFVVGDAEATLQAGDMVLIPSDTPHTVEALEDSLVLDFMSPAREDWKRGDDAYLRG